MTTLSERLKYVREKVLDVSQSVMAARLKAEGGLGGTTSVSVMRYEKGERMPGADYVGAVAKVGGVDVRWLLTGEGEAGGTAARGKPDADADADGLDAEIHPTYRGLLLQMERVLAASEYGPDVKLELLGRVNDGMRIAGLMAEGELSRERIRALVDERELSRHRQGIIGGEQYAGRDRAGRMGGDAGRIPTREEMESEARRLVSERDEAAAKEPKKNHS